MNLVKNYYHRLDFCVITPYDAQRGAIAQRLKAKNLPWESVYNVDSFQGACIFSLDIVVAILIRPQVMRPHM